MKKILIKTSKILFLALTIVSSSLVYLNLALQVQAAQAAGESYMRCDRMKASTAPGTCLVVFTTSSTTTTEATFKLTLDSEWVSATNFSTTPANYTISTSGLPAGVTAMVGVATANAVSGQTITFPISPLAVSTKYGFFITGTGLISNPAASTTISHILFTADSGVVTLDTKDVAVPTIADDQVLITASVAPTFTFTFGNNAQALGVLTSASVTNGSGTAVTVVTNAPSGWFAWVKNANTGLTSVNASKTILNSGSIDAAPTTLSAGTEGYVLDVDLTTDAGSGGTVTIDPEYLGVAAGAGGTLSNSAFQLIASSDGTANSDVITLVPKVAISGTTAAASDYTDTLTVVGAGRF